MLGAHAGSDLGLGLAGDRRAARRLRRAQPRVRLWERRHSQPLVQLSLLDLQNFRAEGAILAGVQFALVGASVFGAIWAQDVLGFSAIRAGAALLPLTLPLLVVAPLAGRLYDRIGPRPLLTAGSALIAFGFAWMAFRLHVHEYV